MPSLYAYASLVAFVAASVATGPQTQHVFPTPGAKTVTLTTCNASGCSSTTRTLTVLDPRPAISGVSVPLLIGSAEPAVSLSAHLTGRPPVSSTWTISSPSSSLTLQGATAAWTPTSLGAHQILLRAANGSGVAFAGPLAASVVPSTFADVAPTHWAWNAVELLAANSITVGCAPLAYCPDAHVTRDQMAVVLIRAARGPQFVPPPPAGLFADVAPSSFPAPFAEQLFRDGITAGCATAPLRFCPSLPVTRDQMAVFLLRAKYGPAYQPPPATGTVFTDVPAGAFAAAWIERLAAEGISGGCGDRLYCPGDPVTRAQLAVFLTRTFSLTARPTPSLFKASLCEVSPCVFPAGLPLHFNVRVTGGLPASYDYDWAGDGVFEETSPYPVAFHTYSSPGTFSPRVRLRAGSWTSTLAHSPIVIRLADASQAPTIPSSLTASYQGTVSPTPLDAPGTLWRTSFALRAVAQRQTGFLVFHSTNGSPYRPVAVLPGDLSRPLLLPFLCPGASAHVNLVAFNPFGFSSGSPVLALTAP